MKGGEKRKKKKRDLQVILANENNDLFSQHTCICAQGLPAIQLVFHFTY